MVFCTLFDSFYLDKGLALYRSLERVADDFKLYIFCFDDMARDVLNKLQLKHAIILHHSDFEDDTLLQIKKERSKAEYCWTCTPVVIEYVLNVLQEPNCTYIDADLYFFENPRILFREIEESGCDIVITEHRFSNSMRDRRFLKRSGKYCVEFNFFNQSENAKKALSWWKERCFEWCYHIYEADRMGDQKYLEKFPSLFEGVHELQHLGGGVAPWNIRQYALETKENDSITLVRKRTGETFPLVFYHFQNMRYLSEDKINISSETSSKELKDAIYRPYLAEIEKCRKILAGFGVSFSVKKIYAKNKLIAFMQAYVLRFKIKSLSDVYDLRQFREMDELEQ